MHDEATPAHLQIMDKKLGVYGLSIFKNNSLLIESWKCKMPHKCLIIWTVCAFGGKEIADERWGEGATEVNAQGATLACALQLSWLSCWLRCRSMGSQTPAPSQSLEESTNPVSLRSQNEGNEGNMLHTQKIVLLAKPHNAVQEVVKPWGLQHLCWFVQIQGWQDVSQNLLYFPSQNSFFRRLQTIQMERLLIREVKQNRSKNEGGIRKKLGRGKEDKQQKERKGWRHEAQLDLVASFENRLFSSSRSHEGKLWYWMCLCWTLIIQRSPSRWLSILVSSPSQYSVAEIVFLTPSDSLTPPTQHRVKLCNLLCKPTPSPKWSCTTYFFISPHFLVLLSLILTQPYFSFFILLST